METRMLRYLLIFVLLFMSVFCFCQDIGFQSSDFSGQESTGGIAAETAKSLVQAEVEKVMEEEGSFYILTDDDNNQTIVQEFKWEGSDDVFMYHFVIEKMNDLGVFEEYDAQDIETNFIDCTLVAGEYRYKIGLYNFLGIIELETDWVPVTVKKAIKPAIKSVYPDYIYFDAGVDSSFTVRGSELSEFASFKIVNVDNGLTLPAVVVDKNLAKGSFTLQVNTMSLEVGNYTLSVRNEGGLTFDYKTLTFVHSRAVDICISFGIGYPLSTNPALIEDYWYWQFGFDGDNTPDIPTFHNLTGSARFTVMPLKTKTGNYGFTLGASPHLRLTYSGTDNSSGVQYSINSQMFSYYAYINYQYGLGYKFVFDAHAGGGISTMNIEIKYTTGTPEKLWVIGLCFKGGLAMQFFPLHHLYFELGCDYVFNLFGGGIKMQYVDPVLSLGWRF